MNHPAFGRLASLSNGPKLPLQVLESRAGFYIGTCTAEGPYSRESVEYWREAGAAQLALEHGLWTQRANL
jgi:hypothetical protein